MTKALWCVMLLIFHFTAVAQRVTVKGIVRDKSGESLPSAHVIIIPDSLTTVADANGKFLITISKGVKQMIITYTGYESFNASFNLASDTTISFSLNERIDQLNEVVITSNRYKQIDWIETTRSGTTTLSPKEITGIPVLGGESDVIKVLQLLPGTVRGVEGSSDLFVRGGAADQNLVLLDDVPIYNTSHLFGFISVFNPDILENVESVNGGFPAHYGGRLSSVLNIETRSTIAQKTNVSGNIGLLASRLMIEQPIVKEKLSVWVSGRRTYVDQVVKAVGEELPYYFYDLNGKIIYTPTSNDNIEFVAYGGEDILNILRDRNNDGDGLLTSYKSGNNSQIIRWQHKFKSDWGGKFSFYRTAYEYKIRNAFEDSRLLSASEIVNVGAKIQFKKNFAEIKSSTLFGVDWVRHNISPSIFNTKGTIAELFESNSASGRIANEIAAHGQYEWNVSRKWTLNTGLRAVVTLVPNDYFFIPEPRISARYSLGKDNALKFNYSRMAQFIHRISNSAVTSPTDIWYPVTDSIRPQTSHQISVAWQRYYGGSKKMYVSIESYYKHMNDLIGFEEGTNLFFNTDFESKLIQGKGNAYGFEFLVKKETGKLTGWISYTLSWANRKFSQLNFGNTFPSRYDRRHNGAVVVQYALNKRWAISGVWEFISGSRFTPVIGQYLVSAPTGIGVDLVPQYAPLNSVKLADTHRLDLGIKFKNKPTSKFQYEWFAGVYNAYNRASPIGINVTQDDSTGELKYEQPGLFGLLPFISYGFKF